MNKIVKNWLRPKPKKLSFMTTLVCLDCENLFDSSRTGRPCPYCASNATMPAANWSPVRFGMPSSETERTVSNG